MSVRVLADAGFRRRVAGTDPARWVLHPEFWRHQPAFVATLGLSLLGMVFLAPYTYSGEAGLVSLFVQAFVVWGVVIAARGLAATDVALALVGEMEERGSTYLRGLVGKGESPMDLDRLEGALVPHNTALPTPAPIRIFQQVCKEARDRRFESAATLVQPYRDEATEDLFRLQNLQKIALWLGILGTFVGLLIALRESDVSASGSGDMLATLVQQMYGGLFVSFTASVAGLEVAIVLSLVLLLLRKRQELCFAQMESATVTLLSAARHAINHDDFIYEFTQVNTTVRDLSNRVYEQTRDITERLRGVESRLHDQNERIDAGLERLAGAGNEFERFLREASKAEQQFLGDLAELFEAASFRDLACTLREGTREVGEQVAGRLDGIASRSARQMEAFDASVQELATAVRDQSAGFTASVDRLETEVTSASARNAEAILAACGHLETARQHGGSDTSDPVLERIATRLEALDRTLRQLAPRMAPRLRDLLASMAPRWWNNGAG